MGTLRSHIANTRKAEKTNTKFRKQRRRDREYEPANTQYCDITNMESIILKVVQLP